MNSKHLFIKTKPLSHRLMKWGATLLLLLILWNTMKSKVPDPVDVWIPPPTEPPGSVIVTSGKHAASDKKPQTETQTDNTAAFARSTDSVAQPADTTANPHTKANAETKPDQPVSARLASPVAAAPELAKEAEADLRRAIDSWQKAWQTRDLPTYLSLYGPNFEPSQGISRQLWADTRKARIASKQKIELSLQNLSLQMHGNNATVKFTQVYADERFRMKDRKTMVWQQEAGRWLIRREFTD